VATIQTLQKNIIILKYSTLQHISWWAKYLLYSFFPKLAMILSLCMARSRLVRSLQSLLELFSLFYYWHEVISSKIVYSKYFLSCNLKFFNKLSNMHFYFSSITKLGKLIINISLNQFFLANFIYISNAHQIHNLDNHVSVGSRWLTRLGWWIVICKT